MESKKSNQIQFISLSFAFTLLAVAGQNTAYAGGLGGAPIGGGGVVAEDTTPPSAPGGVSLSPSGPSSTSAIVIKATSGEAKSTAKVYKGTPCTTLVTSGTVATLLGSGIALTAPSNATTKYCVTLTDEAGNASVASSVVTYIHDSTAPATVSALSTDPASPGTSATPKFKGTAEANSTVKIYSDIGLSNLVASGTAATFGGAGITVNHSSLNAAVTYYITATDAAGNVSVKAPLQYEHDDTAPTISGMSTDPLSPNNSVGSINIMGTTDKDAVTVRIYSDSGLKVEVANGSKADFTGAGISVNVDPNTSYVFYVVAEDAAGNKSNAETIAFSTIVAPDAPLSMEIGTPGASGSSKSISIKGTMSDNKMDVKLYSDKNCSVEVANGTGSDFENAGIAYSISGSDGVYEFWSKAFDGATGSNCSAASAAYTLDTTPPAKITVWQTLPAGASINVCSSGGTFNVKGTAPATTESVKIFDGSGNELASGTAAQFGLGIATPIAADSTLIVNVKALDAVGNASIVSANKTVINDCTAPALAFSSHTDGNISQRFTRFTGTCGVDTASLTANIANFFEDSDCSDGTWSSKLYQLQSGANAVTVTAQDTVGNSQSKTVTLTLTQPESIVYHFLNSYWKMAQQLMKSGAPGSTSSGGVVSNLLKKLSVACKLAEFKTSKQATCALDGKALIVNYTKGSGNEADQYSFVNMNGSPVINYAKAKKDSDPSFFYMNRKLLVSAAEYSSDEISANWKVVNGVTFGMVTFKRDDIHASVLIKKEGNIVEGLLHVKSPAPSFAGSGTVETQVNILKTASATSSLIVRGKIVSAGASALPASTFAHECLTPEFKVWTNGSGSMGDAHKPAACSGLPSAFSLAAPSDLEEPKQDFDGLFSFGGNPLP